MASDLKERLHDFVERMYHNGSDYPVKAIAWTHVLQVLGREAETDWEYGIANFGDLEDVIVHARGKDWAEGAVQPEYGDYTVRRRKAGEWEKVPE